MEAIQDAIRRLESIPSTTKKRKDVEAAIIQLSSTARLLDLPSASPNTFARLAENLRGRLLPLYRVSLSLTLDYAIAVFRFIHYSKLVPILQVGHSLPNSWETLLVSLFSGLLDLLEENSNNKIRENIAYALYPVLCPLYFVPTSGPPLAFHGELLSTAYQILTATVTSHPRNAATLREHHIQRKSLGITISQTKDFLAIESLLDLFGSIIPSLKGGRDKRTAFIKDVFDPVVFKDTGNKIHKLLEDISTPDWSVTAEKIVKILSENDLSFPQPFEASRLLLNESLTDSFSPFYIDNKKFVINIDKDGRIETLSIPYSTIKNILVSRLTNDNVQMIVQLVKSPLLGNQTLLLSSEENSTISWEVKKLSLNDLVKALRCRDLNVGKLGSKLSKVKPIELDFHSNKQDVQILTQKRFEQLSQSWALPISPNNERKIVQLETSPLLPDALQQTARTSNSVEVLSPALDASKQPLCLTSFSTVSVYPYGNPSLIPQTKMNPPDHSSPATPSPHDGDTAQKTLDQHNAKTLAPKPKRRQLILSDDEFEATFGDGFESISTISKPITKTPPKEDTFSSTTPIEPLTGKGTGKAKTARFQKPEPGSSEQGDLKKSTKRLSPDVEPNVIDVDAEEKPTKARKRGQHEAMSPISARPHKRVKYSRKGRTSSPTALSPSGIDFEEIPKLEPLKKVGLESSTKPRASAMKGKNGKPVPKPKASAKKQAAKVQHVEIDSKAAIITHSANDLPDEVAIATFAEREGDDHGGTTVRRSARTSNLWSHREGTQTRNAVESSTPNKPRKAPWEDHDFLKKAQGLSDQIIPTSDPIHSSPIAELKDAEVTEQSSDIDFFVDNAQSDELGAKDSHGFYATAKVPNVPKPIKGHEKLEEPIVSNHPVQEAVIIDLTTDTSPIVLKKANASKPPDVCVCRPHQAASQPVTEEGMPKKEEHLEEAKVTMAASIPPMEKDKTGGQAFFQKIKIEEKSSPKGLSPRPMFKILKIVENASAPVPHTTSNSKVGIQKNISTPLAMRHKKERTAVNSSLSPFESLPLSNKIQIPPIMAFEVIDRERRKRESIGYTGYSNTRHVQNSQMRAQVSHSKTKPDPMQRILEVVQQINEVIVHNIENRFEKITDNLNTGQRAILEATANSLQNMYHESARHFNEMVDLEEDYTSHRTIITSRTHDYVKSSEQLVQCFKDVALEHSRQTLSKRLPATLFARLPAIILNPAIKF